MIPRRQSNDLTDHVFVLGIVIGVLWPITFPLGLIMMTGLYFYELSWKWRGKE